MTELSDSPSAEDLAAQKRGKRTLLMILGISVLPIALAYAAFFTGLGVPDSTVNAGTLIDTPTKVEGLVPADFWQEIEANKKWRLMIPVGEDCNQRCQENLYTTRQVHIRLGEKSPRVERFAVNIGGGAGDAVLKGIAAEHPLLQRVDVNAETWAQWQSQLKMAAPSGGDHYYYLLDQEGVAMMLYSEQHGNEVLKDIKRALKYSIDYQ